MPTGFSDRMMSRIASGEYTPEELAEFLNALDNQDEGTYVQVYNELYKHVEAQEPGDIDPELKRKIEQRLNQNRAHVIPLGRRRLVWTAAAAAVVIAAGTTFLLPRHETRTQPAVAISTPVSPLVAPPGHTGAILTLADGKKVTLDSAGNGALSPQGAASLQKVGNALQYSKGSGTPEMVFNSVSTPRGRKYELVLSDGTKVWLNAASSIRFPTVFEGKERRVEITGEAYMEVAKIPDQPFVVSTGNSEVTVLGTSFDLMDYKDESNVYATLITGAVKVNKGKVLAPGQQAKLDKATGSMDIKTIPVDPVIAWTRDQLDLGGADLATLMRQLSRWYDVDITFEGAVPDIRIWGILDRNVNFSVVLQYLKENGLNYKTNGNAIVILP